MAFIQDDPKCPLSHLTAELTGSELEEGQQKTAPAAYRSWVLGRLAAKEAAGRLWNLPPAAVEVIKGPNGAPLIRTDRRPSDGGCVSISHTSDAAVAVAAETPVGVDLERLDRPVSPRVWQWAFSPVEREIIYGARGQYPAEMALWCAKEAAAKSWGRGLLNHLNQVRVTRADWTAGRITVGWEPGAGQSAGTAKNVQGGTEIGMSQYQAEVRILMDDQYLTALAEKVDPFRPY